MSVRRVRCRPVTADATAPAEQTAPADQTTARPLTARSVLLSLLLGNTPPRAPVSRLVRTAALFGIAGGTVRTALSRMASVGEVTTNGDGWYELTSPRLLARQTRQIASRRAEVHPWTERGWVQAVVVAEGRRPASERSRVRDELTRARLAELREGVWLRPDNLGRSPEVEGELQWFHTRPHGDPVELAATLWDLDAWAARAIGLIAMMDRSIAPLAADDHHWLAEGFVTSAAVLRHFQADPLLPTELRPTDWPGDELRRRYDEFDTTYRTCLATWFRADH